MIKPRNSNTSEISIFVKKCKFSTPSFTFCVKLGEHGQNSYKHISEMGMILLYIYTSLFFYSILYSGIFWWKLQNFLIFSNFCPETSFVWIFLRIGCRALRPKYEKFVLSQCPCGFFPVTFCVRDTMSYWHFICGTFCLVTFCLWLFVRVTFCPVTFCVCGILSVTFCPSDVLSCNILSVWHFVCVSFCPVAFCPWHFVRVTFCPCDILS